MDLRHKIEFKNIKDLPVKVTDWIGSTTSLVLHTIFFILMFAAWMAGWSFDRMLLVLTTVVSLEAIYQNIFIQMTVNRNTQSLQDVEEDLDEIQEDVQGMEKDIDEIQEDIQEDDVLDVQTKQALDTIESRLQALIKEIETIRHHPK